MDDPVTAPLELSVQQTESRDRLAPAEVDRARRTALVKEPR